MSHLLPFPNLRPLLPFLRLCLCLILTLPPTLHHLHAAVEPAQVVVTDVVAAKNPERFGAHLAFRINNPAFLDSGFEPIFFRWRFDVRGGTDTTCRIANGHLYDTIKDGFWDGATAFLYRVADGKLQLIRTGTVAQHVTGNPNIDGDPGTITFTQPGPASQQGDHLVLNQRFDEAPLDRVADRLSFASDVWRNRGPASTRITRDPTTQAPDRGGLTSLKITAITNGTTVVESAGLFDGTYQGFYPTLEPGKRYALEVWLRQTNLTQPLVTLKLTSVYDRFTLNASTSNSWTKYRTEFTAPAWTNIAPVSFLQIRFQGPGTLWVDRLSIHDTSHPAYTPDPHQVGLLQEFRIGSMRTFGAFNNSQTLASWTDEPELTTISWDINNGAFASDGNKLPDLLRVAEQAQGIPWLMVGGQINELEWPQLIEYLAAPYDPATDSPSAKPWAFKRFSQGRTRPWTEAFPKIRLEYCNEAWNFFFLPWAFNPVTYGQFAEYHFAKAKNSPWWDNTRFETIVNGWIIQPGRDGYGATARSTAPNAQGFDTTAYIGGWERSQFVGGTNLTDTGFQDTLLYAAYDAQPYHRIAAQTQRSLTAAGLPTQLSVYEAGPSYSLPNGGRPYILVEQLYGKSLAAGVCTLDMLLFNSLLGYSAQNYFTFSYGFNWSSHALPAYGAHPYPSWSALQLRNQIARGDMLLSLTTQGPARDVVQPENQVDVRNIPLVQSYAFKENNRYVLFLLSRSLDLPIPVTVQLPFPPPPSTTLHTLTGDPRANNLFSHTVRETGPTPVPWTQGPLTTTLPPGSIYVYTFENTAPITPPNNPAVTLSRAPGQPTTSTDPTLRFIALFDRPVDPLQPSQIQINGSADHSEATLTVTEHEPVLGLSTAFLITLSGLRSSGSVSLSLPQGATRSRTTGTPSLPSLPPTPDQIITFLAPEPTDVLYATDDFDIPTPTPAHLPTLESLGSGTGWGPNTWRIQGFSPNQPNGFSLSNSPPLTTGALIASPSHARGGFRFTTAGRRFDLTGTFASFQIPDRTPITLGRSSTTLWMSCLLRKEQANNQPCMLGLVDNDFAEVMDSWRLAIGFFGTPSRTANTPFWSLRVGDPQNGFQVIQTKEPILPGRSALLVLKINFGTRDRIDLFVNPPSLGGGEPDQPSASFTTTPGKTDILFRTLGWHGGEAENQGSLDAIRFGDSFAAVTPISGPTPPKAPSRLQAETTSTGIIRLSWTDNATNETNIELQHLLDSGWTPLATLPPNTTEFLHTNAAPGSTSATLSYRVRSRNLVGTSAFAAPASITPSLPPLPQPRILQLPTGDIDVRWAASPPTLAETAPSLAPGTPWTLAQPTPDGPDLHLRITPNQSALFLRLRHAQF